MLDLRDKRVVVTGGAGFVGNHVVTALKKRGLSSDQIIIPRTEQFDLRKKEDCEKAVAGADVVIHLAAVTGGIEFHRTHPGATFYDNLMMGVHLMEASRTAGVKKFVGIGSATEYPEGAPVPYTETSLWTGYPEPLHAPYSFAKEMLLVQAQAYFTQYGFVALHLMPTNMYGPGEVPESGYVIPSLMRRIGEAKKNNTPTIEVWGTGKPTRDFLYVEDAAELIITAAEQYDRPDPLNLGSGEEVTIKTVVENLATFMNYQGEIIWNTDKPDGQARRVLDTTKMKEVLGDLPRTPFLEGLRRTTTWFESQNI